MNKVYALYPTKDYKPSVNQGRPFYTIMMSDGSKLGSFVSYQLTCDEIISYNMKLYKRKL